MCVTCGPAGARSPRRCGVSDDSTGREPSRRDRRRRCCRPIALDNRHSICRGRPGGRDRHADFGDQLLRGLVQAGKQTTWGTRDRAAVVDVQHVFHVSNESSAGLRRNDILLLQMRFEIVFFSVRPIVLSLARSTMFDHDAFVDRGRLPRPFAGRTRQGDQLRLRRAVEDAWSGRVRASYLRRRRPRSLLRPAAGRCGRSSPG